VCVCVCVCAGMVVVTVCRPGGVSQVDCAGWVLAADWVLAGW